MIRRKKPKKKKEKIGARLPDALPPQITDKYTFVPNAPFRNPKITSVAKGILVILLGNKPGWTSNQKMLLNFTNEKIFVVRKALTQLEKFGYLARLKYQYKETGRFHGQFWAIANQPFVFNIDREVYSLNQAGLELTSLSLKKISEWGIYKATTGELTRGLKCSTSKINKDNRINDPGLVIKPGEVWSLNPNNKELYKKKNINKKIIDILLPFNNKKFVSKWDEYKQYKLSQHNFKFKSASSEKACLTNLKNMSGDNKKEAIKIIDQSMANGWKGLFKIKENTPVYKNGHTNNLANSKSNNIPPLDIIRKIAGTISSHVIYNHKELFDKENNLYDRLVITETQAAYALYNLYMEIKKARPKNVYKVTTYSDQIGSPSKIVSEYIYWLGKETWIDNITEKLFVFDHSLFKRFLKQYSDEIGLNVITGGY